MSYIVAKRKKKGYTNLIILSRSLFYVRIVNGIPYLSWSPDNSYIITVFMKHFVKFLTINSKLHNFSHYKYF